MKLVTYLSSAFAAATLLAGSAHATVYTLINQDIPPATALGTITTDGALGMLSAADIVSADVTVADGVNSSPTMALEYFGGLTATSTGLFFDFTNTTTDLAFVVFSNDGNSAYCVASGPRPCSGVTNDESIEVMKVIYNGPVQSSVVEIAKVSAVPEPATWTMTLIGMAGLGASLRSRRKRAIALA